MKKLILMAALSITSVGQALAAGSFLVYGGGPAIVDRQGSRVVSGTCPGSFAIDCFSVKLTNTAVYTWYTWTGPYSGKSVSTPPPKNENGTIDGVFFCEDWVEIKD